MNRMADAIKAFDLYNTDDIKMVTQSKIRKSHSEILLNHLGANCNFCKSENIRMNIDHITPLCMAGDDDIKNLQVLCWRCHEIKSRVDRQISTIASKYNFRGSSSGMWLWFKPREEIRDFYTLCYKKGLFTIKDFEKYKNESEHI